MVAAKEARQAGAIAKIRDVMPGHSDAFLAACLDSCNQVRRKDILPLWSAKIFQALYPIRGVRESRTPVICILRHETFMQSAKHLGEIVALQRIRYFLRAIRIHGLPRTRSGEMVIQDQGLSISSWKSLDIGVKGQEK